MSTHSLPRLFLEHHAGDGKVVAAVDGRGVLDPVRREERRKFCGDLAVVVVTDETAACRSLPEFGQPRPVARRLDEAWEAMRAAGLGAAFAALYAPRLAPLDIGGREALLAHRIALLGPDYESAALAPPPVAEPLALALARGLPPEAVPEDPLRAALARAFTVPPPQPGALVRLQEEDRLGEALIAALATVAEGARADPEDLAGALAFLRDTGLEDTARRAALQIHLLEIGA